MKSFDIIGAVGRGFLLCWEERNYLLKLAFVPVLMKFLCLASILSADMDSLIRAELILLPAYFAEGWMLAHLVRLIFLGQRWPFQPTGDQDADMLALQNRARGVLGGMVAYVLIHMGMVLIGVGFRDYFLSSVDMENPSVPLHLFAVLGFVFFLWAFRFLWVYIPIAIDVPLRTYAKAVEHPQLSFSMLGAWIIAYVPFFFLIFFLTVPVLMPAEGVEVSLVQRIGVSWLQAIIEGAAILVVTAAVGFGIKELLGGGKKQKEA